MIRIVGSDLKKLLKKDSFTRLYKFEQEWLGDSNIVGVYMGEEVFLCPHLSIDRERGACDTCKYRFRCYTERWGLPNGSVG